ncbi:MAG: DUF6428 family protein [Pirellula sp.]
MEHRLHADKLASIMKLAESTLKSESLPIEIEYGQDVASIYTVGKVVAAFGSIQIYLEGKQTDCLAKDKCGVPGYSAPNACC